MKKNNKKGFTLVELVIVVAVMAILVAVAIPTVGAITKSAQDAVDKSNAQTISSIIKLAEANKSKTSDGVATLTDKEIAQALVDAKLGIESGKFVYGKKTGAVTVTTKTTADEDEVLITFAKPGTGEKVGSVTVGTEKIGLDKVTTASTPATPETPQT